ncbi:cysteine synthase A [Alterisphingorhabdus coralli]|uniref:Cysteine synthase A n=1 Tax=Alterisphingorhabdus coralli TaxID=3071408 RepID=A0AA97F8Z5_9SPHN|nr:cysteine synthase A [Parasphingorhabdus sp. SCSIO 66989]WOE76599.1 cysteine synthase A [Parasphingorhabdus sp. SCSIO 66989]
MIPPMATGSTLDLIGDTPLVRLKGPSDEAGCEIYGKCEYANPGSSVKDRAALYMIRDAEARGELKPGGTVIEGTAGNTGIGIALVANALGYKTVIVMPDNQSKEKMDTLRALGAKLVLVPPTKYADPAHFQHVSRRMAEETEGAVWAGQFDNIANRRAHIEGTSKEIWEQLEGRVDGFTCAAGTGGTISGVGMGLKEKDQNVCIALTDPHGAALYNYYAHGELKSEGSSVAEGIGQGRITANLEGAPIDTQFRISDEEGLVWVRRLLAEEGLCLGLSSGINVAGAIELGKQLAKERGSDTRVVTILCDTGFRYLSTLYNPEWLRKKELPVFPWLDEEGTSA